MGYKRFIPLFAFVVFCIAAYLLYRALSAYERAKIVEAIFVIPRPRLALGTLFVAGSYFSLTLFDTRDSVHRRHASLPAYCASLVYGPLHWTHARRCRR